MPSLKPPANESIMYRLLLINRNLQKISLLDRYKIIYSDQQNANPACKALANGRDVTSIRHPNFTPSMACSTENAGRGTSHNPGNVRALQHRLSAQSVRTMEALENAIRMAATALQDFSDSDKDSDKNCQRHVDAYGKAIAVKCATRIATCKTTSKPIITTRGKAKDIR